MAGLLYKDFVAVKGKIYVAVILAWTLFTLVLRVAVPIEMIDFMLMALLPLFIGVLYVFLVGKLETSVVSVDEGRKQKAYFLSLPVSKAKYVASKYIFLLLAFFVVISVSIFNSFICLINCQNEMASQVVEGVQSLIPICSCILLIIPAIELPFFIGFGAKKGMQIKQTLLIIAFFLAIIYLLFGDLTIFDRIDLVSIMTYLNEHVEVLLTLQVLTPYVSLALYYVSYKLSCLLFARKEWEND